MVMRAVDRAIDHPQVRVISRVTMGYTIAAIETAIAHSGLDPIDTLILLFVLGKGQESINNSAELSAQYSAWTEIPPDHLRSPISRRALARSMGLSVETTRRRVEKLIERGILAEVEGGVMAPSATLEELPQSEDFHSANFQLFRRMIAQFRKHKVSLTQAG